MFEVQASEKIYADYQLDVADVGGHSSLVRPDNPIYTLAAALTRIGEHQFPLLLNDATRMFLERLAITEQGQTAIDMRAVAAVPPDAAAAARLSRSPFYNAQLRTTCVATKVEAGHANNALPQHAGAVVNCRILPGVPGAEVEAVIRRLAGDKVRVSVIEAPIASPASPPAPAFMSRIEPLAAKYWPGYSGDPGDVDRYDRRHVYAKQRHPDVRRVGDRVQPGRRARARQRRAGRC